MRSYELIALMLVISIPVAAIALAAGAYLWARDSIARARVPGTVGVVCTLVAAANLLVERRCAGGVNRPVVSAFVEHDACQRSSLVAIQLVVLLALATAIVVRAGELRPPGGGDGVRR